MTLSIAGIVPQWTIADRLRKSRELTGLERAQFAAELGVSRNTVTNYEHGKVAPRRIVLRSWALRTGVSLEWLETGMTPSDPPGPNVSSGCSLHRVPRPYGRAGFTAISTAA